ncbi:MAG: hypothetical protein N2C14_01210, partial [Planctomycetales bacterium]
MTIDQDDAVRRTFCAMQGPSWRWQVAQGIAAGHNAVPPGVADEPVRRAARLLRRCAEGRRKSAAWDEIESAIAVWENADFQRTFKLLALGGCPLREIADRLGLSQAIVETVQRLFFDIEPFRDSAQWIHRHVVAAEASRVLACNYHAAFVGGAATARMLLNEEYDARLEEADRILNAESLLYAKFQEAIAFPLTNERQALAFAKLYADVNIQKAKLKLEQDKFRHRCDEDHRKRRQSKTAAEEDQAQAAVIREKLQARRS